MRGPSSRFASFSSISSSFAKPPWSVPNFYAGGGRCIVRAVSATHAWVWGGWGMRTPRHSMGIRRTTAAVRAPPSFPMVQHEHDGTGLRRWCFRSACACPWCSRTIRHRWSCPRHPMYHNMCKMVPQRSLHCVKAYHTACLINGLSATSTSRTKIPLGVPSSLASSPVR